MKQKNYKKKIEVQLFHTIKMYINYIIFIDYIFFIQATNQISEHNITKNWWKTIVY